MRQVSDHDQRRSRWIAAAVLCALFGILVWPVVFGTDGKLGDGATDVKYPTSEMGDQRKHHEHTILAFAQQWPSVDLVNYSSATSPGYHLLLALVARYVSHDLVVLQLAGSLLSFGLLLVVWRYGARHVGAWPALALMLPFVASSYVIGSGIWLVTDNAGLLFACLALGGAMMIQPTAMRTVRWGLYAACAVGIRQIHVWVAAPVILAGLLGGPLRKYAPRLLTAGSKQTMTWLVTFATFPALVLPFVIVGALALAWGGLTPPAYTERHSTDLALANYPLTLALFGAFGVFFLPMFVRTWNEVMKIDRWLIVAVILGVIVSLIFPTSFDQSAGRWGGAIWELVRRMPDVAGRSIVFPPLAALGAVVAVHAWRAAGRAGRAREATVLLLSLLGWMIAESFNTQSGQRYCEPMILVGLAWLAALSASPTEGTARFVQPHRLWWTGPMMLGASQIVLCIWTVYLPVIRWQSPA